MYLSRCKPAILVAQSTTCLKENEFNCDNAKILIFHQRLVKYTTLSENTLITMNSALKAIW